MYPLSWTTGERVFIMHYSYEYKLNCVDLYRHGQWPETPEGIDQRNFRLTIRRWVRIEDSSGPEALRHIGHKNWTAEEKYELVSQVLAGRTSQEVALGNGINPGILHTWVRKYKTLGYNGLINKKKGRPCKDPDMKKENIVSPAPLNESEREELIRLRAENEYIKAENAVIKKEIALREEKQAARLKAKKQQSSENSVKKDSN